MTAEFLCSRLKKKAWLYRSILVIFRTPLFSLQFFNILEVYKAYVAIYVPS
jgi:hypothetical protein